MRAASSAFATHLFDEGLAGRIEPHHCHLRTVRGQLFLRPLQRGHGSQIPQVGIAQINLHLRRHVLVIERRTQLPR